MCSGLMPLSAKIFDMPAPMYHPFNLFSFVHVAGPLHILLVGKEGRIWFNIICLNHYQFEKITW